MRVLDVFSKDVYVVFEMSKTDLERITLALEGQEIEFNNSLYPGQEDAVNYLTKEFFPSIVKVLEGLSGDVTG